MARGSTRSERQKETISALTGAARERFAMVGYAATSMDELCASVGLTRGALYHNFGGKKGLFEAVVEQIDGEIATRLDQVWSSHQDPWEAFRAACRAYLALALEPEVQRVLFRDAPAVLGQRLREIDQRSSLASTIEALQALQIDGRIKSAEPEAVARLLAGAMVDAALWIAQSERPEEALVKAQTGLDALLEGLLTP
ncbi:MAG: TetR/AcrR family transcriptional regulator [Myxococcota bacterium]